MAPKRRKRDKNDLTAPLLDDKPPSESTDDSIMEAYKRKRGQSFWLVLKNAGQNRADLEAVTFTMTELDRFKEQLRRGNQYEVFYQMYLLDMQLLHLTGIGKEIHKWLVDEVNSCLPYVPTKQEVVDLIRSLGEFVKSDFPQKTRDGRQLSVHKVCKLVTIGRTHWNHEWGLCPEEDEFTVDMFRKHMHSVIKPMAVEAEGKKSLLEFFIRKLLWPGHEGVFRGTESIWKDWADDLDQHTGITLHWASVGKIINFFKGQGQMQVEKLQDSGMVSTFVETISTTTLPLFLWNMSLYKGLLIAQLGQAQNVQARVIACMMTAGITGGQLLANYVLHYIEDRAGQL